MITPGNWKKGHAYSIVSDVEPDPSDTDILDRKFYGGKLIAESISNPDDAALMIAAKGLLKSLQALKKILGPDGEYSITRTDKKTMGMGEVIMIGSIFEESDAAIAQATGGQS